jgi:uncharacterized repeat protein (TIGR03803 family)
MKKVQEPMVIKTLTVATSRIPWQPLIGLLAAIVVMSVVLPSRAQLHHVPPAAPSFMVLYSFAGHPTDGEFPEAGLVRDGAGNLYSTTAAGGADQWGVVFKLSPTATETVLHSFTGGADGGNSFSSAGLVRDGAGNLYGTTNQGGAACSFQNTITCGVVFKLSPTGAETVLHTFTGGGDGGGPLADLVRDTAGNLYGTTLVGGATSTCSPPYGCGVVFKLSPAGTETVLHSFIGADGANPQAGLIRDTAGNLYGTTNLGGAHNSGVVFKLSPTGTETVLYGFTGGADGGVPNARLLRDGAGNLYGTTSQGGASADGVVFELIRCDSEPSGYEFKVLYSFTGGADGGLPVAGLVRDATGNLYGTTAYGGSATNVECPLGCGTVFKLSPAGTENVLHSFAGYPTDGAVPAADLIQDVAGNLYGTAGGGGASDFGVVFKLTP